MSFLRILLLIIVQAGLAGAVWLANRAVVGDGLSRAADFGGAFVIASGVMIVASLVRPSLFTFFLQKRAVRWRLVTWFTFMAFCVAVAAQPRPEEQRGLYGATFYGGPWPEPQEMNVPTGGESLPVLAYPGQALMIMKPEITFGEARTIIRSLGGDILARVPMYGIYLVGVAEGDEEAFTTSANANEAVAYASENLVLGEAADTTVDLTSAGLEPRTLVALISGTAAGQQLVMAQLDNFIGSEHGKKVRQVGTSVTGEQGAIRVHVGGLPCGRLMPALCSSSSMSVIGLAAVMAGAELNGQKVAVNLSWSAVPPRTENERKLETGDEPGANAWALPAYERYYQQVAAVLGNSAWARQGNVLVSLSSGNGVRLVEEIKEKRDDEVVLDYGGVDVTAALDRVRARHPGVMNTNLVVCGATGGDGTRELYSNYGGGMVNARVPKGMQGTSYAAPLCWGAAYNAWMTDVSRSSAEVVRAVYGSAKKNSKGMIELDQAGVVAAMRGEQAPATTPAATPAAKTAPKPAAKPAVKKAPTAAPKAKPAPTQTPSPTPVAEPAPVATPTPSPVPAAGPVPTVPDHYACAGNAACNAYSSRHCGNGGALCAASGTCHCTQPTEFGGWTKCPCGSGYTCIDNYCGATAGGWPDE